MVGKVVHQYQFLERIGAGGMGEIFKALDTRLNRSVAIKVLTSSSSGDPERRRRFLQEAQAASALNHPNIITIHDILNESDAQFMVMEYVHGKTLVDVIPKGGLRVPQVLKYAIQMADALQVAHAAGIIHRDLKPGNVMATDSGLVKILDFGLAKLQDRGPVSSVGDATQTIAEAPLTVEGTIIGTVSYMSPEQAQGKKVDARSDIFSFGLVLYEMATGARAFSGDNALSTLSAILRDEARPIMEIAPDVPPHLEQVIARCLRKNPDDRWQSMRDVQQALGSLKYESDSGMLYKSRLGVPAGPPSQGAPLTSPSVAPIAMGTPVSGGPMTPPPPPIRTPASPARPTSGPSAPGQMAPRSQAPNLQTRPPTAQPGAQKKSSGGLLAIVGSLALVAAAAGGGFWWLRHRTPPPVEEPLVVATEPALPPLEPPPPEPAPVVEAAMNNDNIVEMVKEKLPTTLIMSQIRAAEKTDFNLSGAEVIRLTKGGVPESVIEAMRNPKKAPAPTPASSPAPVQAAGKQPPAPVPNQPKSPPQQPAPQPQPTAAVTPPAPTPAPVPAPAPASAAPAPAPVVAVTRVVLNDGTPFSVTLSQDIPNTVEESTTVRLTVTRDVRVGDLIVVAKGATVTGVIVEGAKKRAVFLATKVTMRLLEAEAAGGQKIKIRGLPGKRSDGQYARPVDTGKSKPKDVAATAGTEYIAYVDGEQNVTVTK